MKQLFRTACVGLSLLGLGWVHGVLGRRRRSGGPARPQLGCIGVDTIRRWFLGHWLCPRDTRGSKPESHHHGGRQRSRPVGRQGPHERRPVRSGGPDRQGQFPALAIDAGDGFADEVVTLTVSRANVQVFATNLQFKGDSGDYIDVRDRDPRRSCARTAGGRCRPGDRERHAGTAGHVPEELDAAPGRQVATMTATRGKGRASLVLALPLRAIRRADGSAISGSLTYL